MSFEVGTRLGDYEILQVLGEGGMGKVYKVRNVFSDRVEAIKILLPNLENNQDLAQRFVREIKVQASLTHPNIAALYTAQRVDNQLLMIMEFVEGHSLDRVLAQQGRVPVAQAVDCISQVLSALACAHAHGVVHRDIKPANIILTSAGVVKLMDFGIARATADRKLTQTGVTVGSLYYMSPEQIQGAQDLDARADLYSLGITLYELVTGQRPFNGNSDYSIMAAHLQANPVPPVQLDPRMPQALSDIILTAIAKDPNQRFQTADAFRQALQNLTHNVPTMAHSAAAAAIPGLNNSAPALAQSLPPPPVRQQTSPPPAMAIAAPAASSSRWLYIGAGSLVTIAALALVLTQAPKYLQTRANAPDVSKTANNDKPSVVAPVTETSSIPGPVTMTAPNSSPESIPATRVPDTKVNTGSAARPTPVVVARQLTPSSPQPTVSAPVQNSAPIQPPQQQPIAPQVTAQQPVPPPAAPAVDTAKLAALEKLRERLGETHVRLSSVTGSLQSLANSMQAQGLSPNAVLTDTLRRAQMYFNEAQNSLQRGDADKAAEQVTNAERAIVVLENRLQR